jgi:hypothetical protein
MVNDLMCWVGANDCRSNIRSNQKLRMALQPSGSGLTTRTVTRLPWAGYVKRELAMAANLAVIAK